MVNGNDIFISLDSQSQPFARTKSNEIQVNCGTIPTSSPSTGNWETCMADRNSWQFTVSWLVGNPAEIKNLLKVGKEYTITVYGRYQNENTPHLWGKAICTQAKATLTKGNLANGTFSFRGNGELTDGALSSSDI